MRVLYADDMRNLDAHMIENNNIPSIVLMENAAEGVVNACLPLLDCDACTAHVFCGTGNNGGDGFAVARKLKGLGYNVQVYVLGSIGKISGDAKTNADFFLNTKQYIKLNDSNIQSICFKHNDIIVDAIFGIGLTRNVAGLYAKAVNAINAANLPVVSVDIPSGIDANTGNTHCVAINATKTVTFAYPKPGHFLLDGKDACGEVIIHPIGITDGFSLSKPAMQVYHRKLNPLTLPMRLSNSHKGTYGTLGLIVSSDDMAGAGLFAAKAATRSGIGLLHVFVPTVHKAMFAEQLPQAVMHTHEDFLAEWTSYSAIAIGPGLGTDTTARSLLDTALSRAEGMTIVVDADALNLIAQDDTLRAHAINDLIMTPHPKEFARLCGLTVKDILIDPIKHTLAYAKKHHVTIVLKLNTSVVAHPDGRVAMIAAGTPGMAKGGSGDVLTGVIGAFAAQYKDSFEAALNGAYMAGLAGEMADEQMGTYAMTAMDTVEKIALAISQSITK